MLEMSGMDPCDDVEQVDNVVEGEADHDWTIIDPKAEFESAVAGLKSMVIKSC